MKRKFLFVCLFGTGRLRNWDKHVSGLSIQGSEASKLLPTWREKSWQNQGSWYMQLTHLYISSVQFTHSVVSDSLWPQELQHARPPCPSRVHSNSHPSSQWCHPAISFSVVPFSSCPQSLPASDSFPMSQLFAWGGRSTGVSALASSFQRNPRADLLQNGQFGSPCSPRDSQESSTTPQFKSINSSALSLLHGPTLTSIHDYWKNHSLN